MGGEHPKISLGQNYLTTTVANGPNYNTLGYIGDLKN